MGDDRPDLTAGFAQFLASAQRTPTGEVSTEALISVMDPPLVAFLENLSVAHWFNEETCRASAGCGGGGYSLQAALELSFVRQHPRGYTFHEVARAALRDRLLRDDPARFRNVSCSVAKLLPAQSPAKDEDLDLERAYLLVSCDEKPGFDYFDALFMKASQSRRYAACNTLLGMIEELQPLLSPDGVRRIRGYRALSALNLRDFDLAEQLFGELYRLDLPDKFAARIAIGLGLALESKGRLEDAVRVYESGLSGLKTTNQWPSITWRLNNQLALVLIRLGDIAKAEKPAERSLDLSKETGDSTAEAASLETLGQLYTRMRNLHKAREFFQNSLDVFQKLGLDSEKSRVYLSLAALEESVGKWDAAEDWYKLARESKTAVGDDYGVAIVDANLGTLYLRRDRPDKSLDVLRTSLDKFRRFRDGLRSSQVLYSMAIASERVNRFKEAESYLKAAIADVPDRNPLRDQLLAELQRISKTV